MAAPTITYTGGGSDKTSSTTTLAITVSTTTYNAGDYLVVAFVMDPTSGAVSFAKTAGTATIGAFVTEQDFVSGSGTAGYRVLLAYAKVTASGTITTVTVTLPSTTAKAGQTYRVVGADADDPIRTSTQTSTLTPSASGFDAAILAVTGAESTTVTLASLPTGWTSGSSGTLQATAGTPTASNVAVNATWWTRTAIPSSAVTVTNATISALFQSKTADATVTGTAAVTTAAGLVLTAGATVTTTATTTAAASFARTGTAAVTGTAAITATALAAAALGPTGTIRPAALGGLYLGVGYLGAAETSTKSPGAPAGLTATPISSSRIDLAWQVVIPATGYDVERDGVIVAAGVVGTSYSDTGLTGSTTYSYRVRTVSA